MKSLLVTISSLIILNMTTQAQTGSTADESQIRDLVKTMEDGWAKKDGAYFAKPFAENADYVVINGMYIKGRTAIAEAHQRIFDSIYKETFIKTEVQHIRFLRPDIAIVHYTGHMTGGAGEQKTDSRAIITITVEKSANGWQIAAFQNTGIQSR